MFRGDRQVTTYLKAQLIIIEVVLCFNIPFAASVYADDNTPHRDFKKYVAHQHGFTILLPGNPAKRTHGSWAQYTVQTQGETTYTVHVDSWDPLIGLEDIETWKNEYLEPKMEAFFGVARVRSATLVTFMGKEALDYEFTARLIEPTMYYRGMAFSHRGRIYDIRVSCPLTRRGTVKDDYEFILNSFRWTTSKHTFLLMLWRVVLELPYMLPFALFILLLQYGIRKRGMGVLGVIGLTVPLLSALMILLGTADAGPSADWDINISVIIYLLFCYCPAVLIRYMLCRRGLGTATAIGLCTTFLIIGTIIALIMDNVFWGLIWTLTITQVIFMIFWVGDRKATCDTCRKVVLSRTLQYTDAGEFVCKSCLAKMQEVELTKATVPDLPKGR